MSLHTAALLSLERVQAAERVLFAEILAYPAEPTPAHWRRLRGAAALFLQAVNLSHKRPVEREREIVALLEGYGVDTLADVLAELDRLERHPPRGRPPRKKKRRR